MIEKIHLLTIIVHDYILLLLSQLLSIFTWRTAKVLTDKTTKMSERTEPARFGRLLDSQVRSGKMVPHIFNHIFLYPFKSGFVAFPLADNRQILGADV